VSIFPTVRSSAGTIPAEQPEITPARDLVNLALKQSSLLRPRRRSGYGSRAAAPPRCGIVLLPTAQQSG
jgi:hypothetical protein